MSPNLCLFLLPLSHIALGVCHSFCPSIFFLPPHMSLSFAFSPYSSYSHIYLSVFINELSFCQDSDSFLYLVISDSVLSIPIQVNSAFVWAATQGAETVIDGCVDPINGAMDEPAFLWSGVFLSQGGAAAALLGGERGKRAAQRLELRAVQVPVVFDPYDT